MAKPLPVAASVLPQNLKRLFFLLTIGLAHSFLQYSALSDYRTQKHQANLHSSSCLIADAASATPIETCKALKTTIWQHANNNTRWEVRNHTCRQTCNLVSYCTRKDCLNNLRWTFSYPV